MIKNYVAYHKSPVPKDFRSIMTEQQVLIPIPGTEHQLEATLDGILRHKDGLLFVHERKTFGQHPRGNDLENNDQFLAYTWVLQQLNMGEIGGVVYDGLWKRGEVPKGKKMEDLFIRKAIPFVRDQLDEFELYLSAEASEMEAVLRGELAAYPNRPWNGCWDDSTYEPLCMTISRGEDVQYILESHYAIDQTKDRTHDDNTTIESTRPGIRW